MAALSTEIATRWSDEVLVALTNPDAPGETTIDTGREAAAIADVESDFLTHGQVALDNTDKQHINIGCTGIIAYLQDRGGVAEGIARESIEDFHKALERFVESDKRRRVDPETESKLVPTDEFAGGGEVRPTFDTRHFNGISVGPPRRFLGDTENE